MATAEQMAKSLLLDGGGVHCLLWEDQDDLVRALIVFRASLLGATLLPCLLSSAEQSVGELRKILEMRPVEKNDENDYFVFEQTRKAILILFLQQAASETIGPWLNGWRSALAKPPGTLIVIRYADFIAFQRHAPDLAGFIGPKIHDASSFLSLWSQETSKRLQIELPKDFATLLKQLPGKTPSPIEIKTWIEQHPPLSLDASKG